MNANSKQIDGTHYRSDYQHWDALAHVGFGPQYYIGAATKYVSRWRKKNGIRDLRKGQHFVEKLMELFTAQPALFTPAVESGYAVSTVVDRFAKANELDAEERVVVHGLLTYGTLEELKWLHQIIDNMIIRTLASGTTIPPMQYSFVRYGEGHETITWLDSETGEVFTLPVDVPPSQRR